MEEKKVTIADAAQFVRDVLSIGNVFKVDPNTDYVTDITGGPATVKVGNADKPIMIWSEKAKIGEHVLLNIYGETMNATEERRWFYSFLNMVPGKVIRDMMMTIINTATSAEDKNAYAAMEVISPFVKEIDEKTKAEFNLFKGSDLAQIVYHKPSKTAQLQTKLFEEDFKASFGKKIRAKSWKLFENMFKALMNVEDEKQLSATFKAEATILGMKQTDAMVRVLVKFIENVDAVSRTLLSTDYPIANLLVGVENLNLYYATMRVFTSGGGQTVDKKASTTNPFVGNAPAQISAGTGGGRLVSIGNGLPIVIPDVVSKMQQPKQIPIAPAAPTVSPMVTTIPMSAMPMPAVPQFGQIPSAPVSCGTGIVFGTGIGGQFGKTVGIDNPVQNRNLTPRVRQILANGKVI